MTAFLVTLALACVHLFAGKLRFLDGVPRSRWLSAAGGISVAYVVLHLLPELSEHQGVLEEAWGALPFLKRRAYLVALLSMVLFYGVERHTKRNRASAGASAHVGFDEAFWVSIGSFAVYNVLIGYLLVRRETSDAAELAFYTVAMALHFLVNDYGLREDHKDAYSAGGRWLLAAAVLAGWAIGARWEVPETTVAVATAAIAGGVILNVFKEELPEDRESRFAPFCGGAAFFAVLLLLAG